MRIDGPPVRTILCIALIDRQQKHKLLHFLRHLVDCFEILFLKFSKKIYFLMVYTGPVAHENEILNKTEPFTFVHLDQSHQTHHQREGEFKCYLQYSGRDSV